MSWNVWALYESKGAFGKTKSRYLPVEILGKRLEVGKGKYFLVRCIYHDYAVTFEVHDSKLFRAEEIHHDPRGE